MTLHRELKNETLEEGGRYKTAKQWILENLVETVKAINSKLFGPVWSMLQTILSAT